MLKHPIVNITTTIAMSAPSQASCDRPYVKEYNMDREVLS